ncbi:hypothetical protein, partial [Chloroflexus aurantiacus]
AAVPLRLRRRKSGRSVTCSRAPTATPTKIRQIGHVQPCPYGYADENPADRPYRTPTTTHERPGV